MKKFLIVLTIVMLGIQAFGYDAEYYMKHRQSALSGSRTSDPIYLTLNELYGGTGGGTGNTYYVDSNVGSEGDGKSWTGAKDTLDEAIDLCTDDNGDVIYVAQGTALDISAAGTVTCDKSGVKIVGCGYGDLRPTFTWTGTAGTWLVSDNAVTVYNCRFTAGISAVVTGFSVSATGDAFTLVGCEFVNPGTATYEFINMITLASGADYVTIDRNKMVSLVTSTGCVNAISASAGVVNRLTITYNDIQGNFITTGAIYSNQANTNVLIAGNTVRNTATGVPAINFTAAATGFIEYNSLYSDTFGTAGVTILDPGSCSCVENYAINTTDKTAILIPPAPALTTQSLTAGSWEDILNKLYYASDGTGAYPATLANDSALAMIMAKGATATPSTYSNTTDSLEAIRDQMDTLNTADQVDLDAILLDTGTTIPGTITTAQADLDILTGATGANLLTATQASIDAIEADTAAVDTASELRALAGTNAMERSVSVNLASLASGANNLFAVTGGPIKITEIVTYVTGNIQGQSTLIGYNIDPTTPATDTAFGTDGTALEINGDVAGTLYTWDGVLAADLVEVTNGVAVAAGTDVSYGLIVPIGMIELTSSATSTGTLTVYITYIPLSPDSVVTAQ